MSCGGGAIYDRRMADDRWDLVATERRRLADELDGLTDEQWSSPSRCDAWTVHQLAAHLIMPFELSLPRFFVRLLRHRFDFDAVAVAASNEIAERRRPVEILRVLRDHADDRWTPPAPGLGVETVLAEVVVHGQDIRNALGLPCTVPAATIERTLAGLADDDLRDRYRRRIDGRPDGS